MQENHPRLWCLLVACSVFFLSPRSPVQDLLVGDSLPITSVPASSNISPSHLVSIVSCRLGNGKTGIVCIQSKIKRTRHEWWPKKLSYGQRTIVVYKPFTHTHFNCPLNSSCFFWKSLMDIKRFVELVISRPEFPHIEINTLQFGGIFLRDLQEVSISTCLLDKWLPQFLRQ